MAMDKVRKRNMHEREKFSKRKAAAAILARVHTFKFLNDGIQERMNLGITRLETGLTQLKS
jgi:hypothetical protein